MDNIHFSISTNTEQAMPLRRAILLYEGGGCHSATVHDIDVEDGAAVIMPGAAVTVSAVLGLARALGTESTLSALLPAELLWFGRDELLWWLPPGRRQTIFRVKEWEGERRAILPHPGLVFYTSPSAWHVWAVKGRRRPVAGTPMWRAPYLNVYSSGAICAGSGATPSSRGVDSLAEWNHAFFASAFSHLADSKPLLRHPGGAGAFWLDMFAKERQHFPASVLVPSTPRRLGDVAELIARGNLDTQ